jgi:iron complex transport system substrate-binding protein
VRFSGLALALALLAPGFPARGEGPRQRIVSLAPSVTETLFELGLGPRVVGVTDYCRFPPEARKIAKVGGYTTPNYEAIAGLKPDLAVLLPEHGAVQAQVAALDVEVLAVDHRTIAGFLDSVLLLGERCGVAERAEELRDELQGVLDRTAAARSGKGRPRVLLCIGRSMGHSGVREVHAAGPGNIHDDIVRLAGGLNAVPPGPAPYPVLSAEGLLRIDPDVIVEFAPDAKDPDAIRREWRTLSALRAVRAGRVLVYTEGFVAVPGPRLVRFVQDVALGIGAGEKP